MKLGKKKRSLPAILHKRSSKQILGKWTDLKKMNTSTLKYSISYTMFSISVLFAFGVHSGVIQALESEK